MMITHKTLPLTALLALSPLALQAELLSATDPSIRDNLCVGAACLDTETSFDAAFDELRMKGEELRIIFADSSDRVGASTNDWSLQANEPGAGGAEVFTIKDVDGSTTPFSIEATAPTSSIYVSARGSVGLGTMLPQANLHIEGGSFPHIQLRQNTSGGGQLNDFELGVNDSAFTIVDRINDSVPFSVEVGALNDALVMGEEGVVMNMGGETLFTLDIEGTTQDSVFFVDGDTSRIGMGTAEPEQALHILREADNENSFALFEAAGAGADAAFLLKQGGTAPTTWEFRNQQSSGRLNIGIAGGNTPLKIDDAANNNLLKLGTNSNSGAVVVTGQLLVNNTALNVPDFVFADAYALRPLADVQAFIDTHAHLPEVPSAAQITQGGVDMAQMQMVLLQKVEELTLYTLAQQDLIAAQGAMIEELQSLQDIRP